MSAWYLPNILIYLICILQLVITIGGGDANKANHYEIWQSSKFWAYFPYYSKPQQTFPNAFVDKSSHHHPIMATWLVSC